MNIQPANDIVIQKAAALLRAGKLVSFPTETVYGLGADATNDFAVAEIFSVKGRPQFNPLIVHVADVAMARNYVSWNETAEKLAAAFFPGPLTLVLPRLPGCAISLLASAGGNTVGIRMPSGKVAQQLLHAAGIPIAAPSANRSGRISPTIAQHVREELNDDIELIVDGGACEVGIESTVVDASGRDIALLRPGIITREEMENVLGRKIAVEGESNGVFKSPGMLASHYAPTLPLRLHVSNPQKNEALLAFGSPVPSGARFTLNLSEKGNLKEAAANLFLHLHALDKPELYSAIGVMPVPSVGIGVAINDRLRRAAVR